MGTEDYQSKLWDYRETGVKPFSWNLYNKSQTNEKILFLRFLKELADTLQDEKLAEKIFCMCLKVYTQTSSRRLISEIQLCRNAGYISKKPHFNTILNYFNDRGMRSVLKHLIELSAFPLAQLERRFAVDSSGISLHQYASWKSIRDKYKEHRKYKKVHVIYGVLTNVAVSCKITKGTSADSPEFIRLLKRCADNFTIEEVSADMAYSSKRNLQAVSDLGAVPYIPFKENATGRGLGIWKQMYKYFKNHQEEFLRHYHKRSNAETGFFMIKSKFGEFIKSKNDVSQENEILAKILCHNICVLIQEIFLQKIEINFLKMLKSYVAQH